MTTRNVKDIGVFRQGCLKIRLRQPKSPVHSNKLVRRPIFSTRRNNREPIQVVPIFIIIPPCSRFQFCRHDRISGTNIIIQMLHFKNLRNVPAVRANSLNLIICRNLTQHIASALQRSVRIIQQGCRINRDNPGI